MKFLLAGALFSSVLFANPHDLTHRPKSFSISNGQAVFVDFETADYIITYNGEKKTASVMATIDFFSPEEGFPVFDSVETPLSLKLDGELIKAPEVKTPSRETTVRVMSKKIKAGSHRAEITLPLSALVDFKDGGVKSAFWTSDLDERQYLERYLPASFEYDQVKMNFTVNFTGISVPQRIYTNGEVSLAKKEDNNTSFRISYPEYYNSSSIFYHTTPESSVDELKFSLRSIDGRDIPSVVYYSKSGYDGTPLESLKTDATKIFQELESDYGAWPHPSLIVYNAGSGGMEYCGATITVDWALGHEMFHSYFARGVMPANGNAGWLDEALATWRDNGYPSYSSITGTSQLSSHPYYTRTTDMNAYGFGAQFMAYLDGKLKEKKGLKPFLRSLLDEKKFSPLFVEDFIKDISDFYSFDFMPDFKKYTYGEKNVYPEEYVSKRRVHQKMTLSELKKFL